MSYDEIEYKLDEDQQVTHIRLDRPDKLNPLSETLIDEFCEAIDRAESDEDIRVIVVSGNGSRAFSSGYDMAPGGEGSDDPVPSTDDLLDQFENNTRHVYAVWECNKPVIAAVQGYCIAGGSDLAMACDIVIATEDSQFGYPGLRMAGTPPTLTYPVVMGLHQAKELLLSGKTVDSEDALRLGMINKVVPEDELWDEVEAEVQEIRKMPGNNVRILKHILNGYADMNGARTMFKYGELFDGLAHQTEYGKEYFRHSRAGGMDAALEFMNEWNKDMRPEEGEFEEFEESDD